MVKMLSEINTDNANPDISKTPQDSTSDRPVSGSTTPVLEVPTRTPSSNGCTAPATYGSYTLRQNQVSTVTLHGVQIVCLFIDGKERLCLAQISNTLLKSYSYNEIHNRRVALGITCVQCTPVQLEILRRAGAMPISSRRCGMITKREAERLVKSFLEDPLPPKLPENFCFDVHHDCGWGCQGNFEPSRYNSSRAKCIKCTYCNMYFSPNKFIFHFHRTPTGKYNHPDAANFNSWRRHLKLVANSENDDMSQMWEDVKAMFNGGSRKRILAQVTRSTTHTTTTDQAKKPRYHYDDNDATKPVYQSQYPPFPMLSFPGKPYQFGQLNHSPPFGIGFPFTKDGSIDASKGSHQPNTSWGLQSILPTYNMFWNNPLNRPSRNGVTGSCYPLNELNNHHDSDIYENENENDSMTSSPSSSPSRSENTERFSAFRPVGKNKKDIRSQINDNSHEESEDENEEINITDYISDRENSENLSNQDERSGERKDVSTSNKIKEQEKSEENEYTDDKAVIEKCKKEAKQEEEPVIDDDAETGSNNGDNKDTHVQHKSEDDIKDVNENFSIAKSTLRIPMALNLSYNGNIKRKDEIYEFTKEELQEQLKHEIETRKSVERNIELMKESMTNELEKERQVRYSLQQKLKEAHDALHNFSCKMLASRQCDECTYKDDEVST